MDTYHFLQQYWWFIVSLLGAILVFLLFVQGGNSLIFCLGKTEEQRKMIINSTGWKWEFTFTTLVTFGGAFFASFPLFYSTSFGGAYWLWMIILFSFVLQAVSYEFQSKAGNLLGKTTYRVFLAINEVVGPLLLGGAVATFFTGSAFYINKSNMADTVMPVISQWVNAGHGLDALLNPWNVVLGLAVFFLARILGSLYFINNINEENLVKRCRRSLWANTGLFLVFFLAFVIRTLLADGFAVNPETGEVFMEPYKYLTNFIEMPIVLIVFLIGVLAVLWGIIRTLWKPDFDKGIWFAGIGTVLTVLALLLVAGYNNTAYYPSTADLQSSLTLANSCSSQFTLRVMAYVSILAPFVLAYIFYVWRSMDKKKIDAKEMGEEGGMLIDFINGNLAKRSFAK
ncbi:MAG: cytochrome d ubiquinol oxidase subunit II [Bacteroides sp.]|nr:cytochrome d ubiquinol oxidase subunit II [Bacteroides sp.]